MQNPKLQSIRLQFQALKKEGRSFEQCLVPLLSAIKEIVCDADNWQIIFDLLHWDWTEDKEPVAPEILDAIAKRWSHYGQQGQIIEQQIEAAQEWRESLERLGISPAQGLSLARVEADLIKDRQKSVE